MYENEKTHEKNAWKMLCIKIKNVTHAGSPCPQWGRTSPWCWSYSILILCSVMPKFQKYLQFRKSKNLLKCLLNISQKKKNGNRTHAGSPCPQWGKASPWPGSWPGTCTARAGCPSSAARSSRGWPRTPSRAASPWGWNCGVFS